MENYTNIERWNDSSIRIYQKLNLTEILNNPSKNIIAVQKSMLPILDKILEEKGIKTQEEGMKLKNLIWRSWYTEIITKEWELWILRVKWPESTIQLWQIADLYFWWSDIVDKANRLLEKPFIKEIGRIPWENLRKYKTELLLLLWPDTVNKLLSWTKQEVDKIITKFKPILTKDAISNLGEWIKKPEIIESDSNSELWLQIEELWWKQIWWVEIVQSWASLIATNSFPVKNGIIYEPSWRDKKTWDFKWEKVLELDKDSQIRQISESIERSIDWIIWEIWWWKDKNPFTLKMLEAIKEYKKSA